MARLLRSAAAALTLTLALGGALTFAQAETRLYLPLVITPPAQANPTYTGEATYYDWADGSGNCSFDPTPADLMVGAMNESQYGMAELCGAYVELTGPNGTITVRIVDRCPECRPGDIDLSPAAFERIAPLVQGRVRISWRVVSPPLSAPVSWRFKDGSSQWWTGVQVLNHRNPITTLEYKNSAGTWVNVRRERYNYFVEPAGMGPGPFTFRITDIYGNQLVESGVPLLSAPTPPTPIIPGSMQFPPGP
jgi:expansin (peptidoglycan-binding protein)